MISLLLSPNGRIGRNRFWQGMVILTVISILVAAGSSMLGTLVALLGYLLIYPYICVYGKRLHDIGTTAWWVNWCLDCQCDRLFHCLNAADPTIYVC
ncbi:MAG: DUF805 domain-containing protein [Pseudomonadota bacterium]